jgi:glycine betaine/choline ABC-type transport system substrate-binding protein
MTPRSLTRSAPARSASARSISVRVAALAAAALALSACGSDDDADDADTDGAAASGGRALVLAAGEECADRPFCQPGLEDVYGIAIDRIEPLGVSTLQTKEAVRAGDADLGLVLTTDGTLESFGLVLLEDDEGLQLADNLVPLVNTDASTPELEEALNSLAPELTTEDLAELNARVDQDRERAEDVAGDFLEDNGLLGSDIAGSGSVVVGGPSFTEGQVMVEMYRLLLEDAGFDVTTQVVDNRELYLPELEDGDITVVPEYAATVTDFINRQINGADADSVASNSVEETIDALEPLAAELGLVPLEPAEAVDQNAFAVTEDFAIENDIRTLSELGAYTQGE